MAPGNKFDLASVSSEPVRRRSQMLMQLLGEVNVVYDYRFCIGLSGLISWYDRILDSKEESASFCMKLMSKSFYFDGLWYVLLLKSSQVIWS